MFEVLDDNKDKAVTESDFENLAVRYLCQSGLPTSTNTYTSYTSNTQLQGSQVSQTSYYSNYSSTKKINTN